MRDPKLGFVDDETPALSGGGSPLARWYGKLRNIVLRGQKPASLSYRHMSRLIEREFPVSDNGICLAFTSAGADQVTTDALLMLAFCLRNELDSRVLLVDARLRDPDLGLAGRLGLLEARGFVEIVREGYTGNESLIQATAVAGVDVLPAGDPRGSGSVPLHRDNLRELLDCTMALYDHVLVGVGSVLGDTRVAVTLAEADTVFLLAEENQTFLKSLDDCRQKLRDSGVQDVRVVISGRKP